MKTSILDLLVGFTMCLLISCQSSNTNRENVNDSSSDSAVAVLSPDESLKTMRLEKGFSIKLVASEPLISTPVAMTFDNTGRIWVVEMTDYRPIKTDSSEQYPLGKVVILQDTNGDGVMDTRKVFIDSLMMPRAICLVDNGLLVATPPNLWYVKIDDDKPGERILVDSSYTVSDNPEGQTNGLLRALDNWIYSAGFGSSKRYRKIKDKWITESTYLRGQWGLSPDDYGHLFYNNNTQNLLGDYLLPGVTNGNKYQNKVAGFNEKIVPDNRVYPAAPTPGVNRGYKEGILDQDGKLINFTAACGPVIYRGGLFSDAYAGNAFVCEPAANLIKRNILERKGLQIMGKQAYQDKEFLVSTDKRFRPVNLYNGPDGALYLVDMYRGVIQDDLSLTEYLKEYSLHHSLNSPVNCGRIYKIVPEKAPLTPATIPDSPEYLPRLLTSKNGWIREKAQEEIVDKQYDQIIPELRELLSNSYTAITNIHALWTLEGLNALRKEDIIPLLLSQNSDIQIHALTVLIAMIDKSNYKQYLPSIEHILSEKDSSLALYIAYVANKLFTFSPGSADHLWTKLTDEYPSNLYIADAMISGIQDKEAIFSHRYKKFALFHKQLDKVLKNKAEYNKNLDLSKLINRYPEGYAIFEGTCQTCHGAKGEGIKFVAPPLNRSDWVTGDKDRLIPIVLYGLTGLIEVSGKVYEKPDITGDMPGFGNDKFSDKALAEVMSFIRAAWSNDAGEITEADVKNCRQQFKNRQESFTMDELRSLKKR